MFTVILDPIIVYLVLHLYVIYDAAQWMIMTLAQEMDNAKTEQNV